MNPPGAAGIESVASGSSNCTASVSPSTVAPVTSGARMSASTLTARPVKLSASLPTASRIFAPEEGRVYSSVTFWVPSAISVARLSVIVAPSIAIAVTAGAGPVPNRTVNRPGPVCADIPSSASLQVTVRVGPSAVALAAVGRTPSTVCAGSVWRGGRGSPSRPPS